MKWVPDSYLDLILQQIQQSDEEVICSQAPTTYFQAVWGDLWQQSTTYAVGDIIHPPTQNGCVYECVTAGDSGATEPGWSTIQDDVFTDGTVEWKTHLNYSLASAVLAPGDFTLSDGDTDGRKLTIAQKIGNIVHTSGIVTHTALIQNSTKTLHYVTEAQNLVGGDGTVTEGRLTVFFEHSITVMDPQ